MQLVIHDANLKKVAYIDNDKQDTLNYYNDTWTRNLYTGSSTFEFTVFKKSIKTDGAIQKSYHHLNEKSFVSFSYKGKSYVFNVMTVEEDEQTIKCYCENLNLELINEYANPYKSEEAKSFEEYCVEMDLLNFTFLSIGINEISDQKRTLEWEGQDTKLARLLSLANKFNAEIDFETHLNADSTIESFVVNVYHEYDENHQGVGKLRNDIQLTYGKNLKSIRRKIDKTGVYNAIRPTGKGKTKNDKDEEVETVVTIAGLDAWSENNADGVREFYQSGDMLYAPLSMQMYPSTFTSETQDDQWIRKDLVVESDNPTVIRATAIRDLKKNAYPSLTYEVDGFIDADIGDTIRIYDDGFKLILLIEARVSDQKISFTNPNSNKTTFANFKALENNLSDGIQAAFERLFEAAKPYTIKLATDNGVIFKNQIGESLVTPTLYKGGKPVVAGVTWRWSLDGEATTGLTHLVRASSITNTATLTVSAYIGNTEVAVDEITFVNVSDGRNGRDGRDGVNGTKGDPGPRGEKGDRGLQGVQGLKGEQGIAGPKGADGRTQYTHIAYADNATGGGFSQTDNRKPYIGMYVDFNATDSRNPTDYRWTKWRGEDGAQGVPGPKGQDGRTPYVHFAYANSADGRTDFSLTNTGNKRYWGTYTDFIENDSTDPTKYSWTMLFDPNENATNLISGFTPNGDTTFKLMALNSSNYVEWGDGGRNIQWLSDGWARLSLTNTTSTTKRFDIVIPNPNPETTFLSADKYYTFMLETRNDKSTELSQKWYYVMGDYSAIVGNNPGIAQSGTKITRTYRKLNPRNGKTVDKCRDIVVLNRNVTPGNTLDIEMRFSMYLGDYRGDYMPFRGGQDYSSAIELSQEQINALNEQSELLKNELEAKASLETVNTFIVAYNNFLKSNEENRVKAEKELVDAAQRVSKVETNFEDMAERWNFIDSYMKSSNEGLTIGKKDGSTSMLFSPNGRISMFSAGKEVMYISQGVIHIENGIFSKTIQIGRFREEQYHLNLDMNIIRYVG